MFKAKKRGTLNRLETKESSDRIVQTVSKLKIFSCSTIGNRKCQQDALYISAENGTLTLAQKTKILAVVCDGIGGLYDGEKASNTAIQMISREFRKVEKIPELNIPLFLQNQIYAIDQTIASFHKKTEKIRNHDGCMYCRT